MGTSRKWQGPAADGTMPSVASIKPNLRLRLDLAAALPRRAQALGLPVSTLVGILVRNDAIAPASLVGIAAEARLSRVTVACTLTASTARLASRGCKRCKTSRNAYLESLIAAHLATPGPLAVLLSKPSPKL